MRSQLPQEPEHAPKWGCCRGFSLPPKHLVQAAAQGRAEPRARQGASEAAQRDRTAGCWHRAPLALLASCLQAKYSVVPVQVLHAQGSVIKHLPFPHICLPLDSRFWYGAGSHLQHAPHTPSSCKHVLLDRPANAPPPFLTQPTVIRCAAPSSNV